MSNTASKKQNSLHQQGTRKNAPLKYVGHGVDQERARLLESITDAFVSIDTEWRFTYVNHRAEAILGKAREELLDRNVWEVFPLPVDSLLYRNAHQAMEKQANCEFHQFHPLLNQWFHIRLYPFQDGLYSFCQDITEQKKAEEQLQLQPNAPWGMRKSMIVTDLQGKIIHWNKEASDLFGYTAEEMLGQTPALLYPRFEKKQFAHDLEQIRNGKEYTGLWKGRRKDGTSVCVDMKTSLLRDTQGKTVGLDAVKTTDNYYNILSWNKAAEKLYGWKKEEVLGKFVDDILQTEYFTNTSSLEASKRLLSRGYWKGKVIQKRKDGTPLTILASVSVIKDGSGNGIGAIAANRDMDGLEE
ncbi:MAG: PAS domain S-box protein [Chloroflexi bacterium]|nr:MAG: PAS domain S-box protein [Chloroflexota bacterium]